MTALDKTDVVSAMVLMEGVVKVCDSVGCTSAYHPLRSGPGSVPGSQKELGQGVLRPGLWPVAVILSRVRQGGCKLRTHVCYIRSSRLTRQLRESLSQYKI